VNIKEVSKEVSIAYYNAQIECYKYEIRNAQEHIESLESLIAELKREAQP
jgi:prefoldin subunit 5